MNARVPLAACALLAAVAALTWWSRVARDGGKAAASPPAAARTEDRAAADLVPSSAKVAERRETAESAADPDPAPRPGATLVESRPADPGALLHGVLLDALDRPCPEMDLWLVPDDAARLLTALDHQAGASRTDADGTFTFADIEPGAYLVGPRPYLTHVPWGTLVEIAPDDEVVDVTVRLPRELYVSGVAVGPDGDPVARVSLAASGGGIHANAGSELDGAFRLGPFLEGAVQIEATQAPGGLIGVAPVDARAGEDGVVVRLARESSFTVHVHSKQGEPLGGDVIYSRIDAPDGLLGITVGSANDGGEMRASRLAPGLYRIMARAKDGRVGLADALRLDAGAHAEVDVTVRAGGRLRIHTASAGDVGVVRVLVAGMIVGFPSIATRVSGDSDSLPPGQATVELVGGNGSVVSRTATVIAGETVDVVFD